MFIIVNRTIAKKINQPYYLFSTIKRDAAVINIYADLITLVLSVAFTTLKMFSVYSTIPVATHGLRHYFSVVKLRQGPNMRIYAVLFYPLLKLTTFKIINPLKPSTGLRFNSFLPLPCS